MKKYRDLREFFHENLDHIKATKDLENAIRRYRYGLMSKDPEITELLSSNHTGVVTPAFTTSFVKNFFSEVLYSDRDELQEEVFKVRGLDKSWKNATNIYNETCMWLIKLFLDKANEKGAMEAYLMFGTRILVKLHEQYFKFPVPRPVAEAVVQKMTSRYLIKKFGTWENVLKYRGLDFVRKGGINYPRVTKFNTDGVVIAINDGVGRIKSNLLQVYSLTVDITKKGELIHTTTSRIENSEGEDSIRDITGGWSNYIENGVGIFTNKANLHNKTYLAAVRSVTRNVKEEQITSVLESIADEINNPKKTKNYKEFIESTLTTTFTYLQDKGYRTVDKSNIHIVLKMVANMWSVKRTQGGQYKLKERMRTIVDSVVKVKTERVLQSITVAVLCYIFLCAVE